MSQQYIRVYRTQLGYLKNIAAGLSAEYMRFISIYYLFIQMICLDNWLLRQIYNNIHPCLFQVLMIGALMLLVMDFCSIMVMVIIVYRLHSQHTVCKFCCNSCSICMKVDCTSRVVLRIMLVSLTQGSRWLDLNWTLPPVLASASRIIFLGPG